MADVCIIVPGIGASTLVEDGRTVWDVSNRSLVRAMLTSGRLFERLTLQDPDRDDGVVAHRPISGVSFIPGFWQHGGSRALLSVLRGHFGTDHVVEFAYDWRRSITSSAASLARTVDLALEARPQGTRAVLVAHSLGGLVSRRYLACEGGAERCSMLVTVGTPYRGSAKALDVLAHGVRNVPGRTGDRLRTLLRSLPSVHELLPTYDCLVGPDGTRHGLSGKVPPAVASTGLYDAAATVRAETDKAIAGLGPDMTPALVVVGQHQWTPTFARWNGDGDFALVAEGEATGDVDRRSRGDGTVSRGAAQPPEWDHDVTRAHVVVGRHMDLPSARTVHQALIGALKGREYMGLGPDTGRGLAVEIPSVVSTDEPVKVRARHDEDHLSLEVWVTDVHGGGPVAHLALANLGGGLYTQVLPRLPSGQYEVAVSGLADGRPHRISDLLVVLPDDIV